MQNATQIRILTVDGHHLFREGVAAVIRTQPDMSLTAQASHTQEAIERFREHKPDVTLMDLRVPDIGGINAMITIRSEFPAARIIILTAFAGDVEVQRALQAGARGYALKNMLAAELLEVIRQVHSGKRKIPAEIAADLAEHYSDDALSNREVEVLRQIGEGNRNRDIANRLFIREETVKAHIKHIMQKLNASDRTQAFVIGIRRGIIEL